MTFIELLKIFKIEKIYEKEKSYNIKERKNFTYRFTDIMYCCGTSISYGFFPDEFIILIESKDFSEGMETKKLHLLFNTTDLCIELMKNTNSDFTNELFPFLSFDKTLVADLEFVSGIIYNVLIPKHDLHSRIRFH